MAKTSRNVGKRPISPAALAAGAILIALLPAIALAVLWKGRHYQADASEASVAADAAPPAPAETPESAAAPAAKPAGSQEPSSAPSAGAAALLPTVDASAGYTADGAPAVFDRETVYEKINGAAPPFLDLGMKTLTSQAYAGKDPKSGGCEIFIYDMGSAQSAAAIYDQERSGQAENANYGDGAYQAGSTLFFHQGPYYVTILNTDEGREAEAFSKWLAKAVSEKMADP